MAINYLEPIAPLKKIDEATGDINYIYPITTANQVIMEDGERLNTILTENLLYLDDGEFESVSDPIDANTLNGKTESELSVANADSLGGQPPEYYVSQRQFENGLDMALVDYVPKTKAPFSFGIDANGNYGYIKDGADTVTPFKLGEVELLSVLTGGTGNTYPYELSYTFTKDYSEAIIVIFSNDTDNNSDNFYKVYSVRNSVIASTSYTNYWNVTDNEWDYFKPTLPTDISYPAVNSKYTNDKDLNKDMYWATGTASANSYACIAYKKDIKANDTAWMYLNFYRRGIAIIFGVK